MCSNAAGSRPRRAWASPPAHADQSKLQNRPPADLVLFLHDGHGLGLVECRLAPAAALGVGGQRLLELVGESEVVHHQPAGLVAENPVDPGDGLHQPVAPHWLVHVHGVQAGRIEAGEPHVAHQHHPQRVVGVAEPVGQRLTAGLVADVGLPFERVRR